MVSFCDLFLIIFLFPHIFLRESMVWFAIIFELYFFVWFQPLAFVLFDLNLILIYKWSICVQIGWHRVLAIHRQITETIERKESQHHHYLSIYLFDYNQSRMIRLFFYLIMTFIAKHHFESHIKWNIRIFQVSNPTNHHQKGYTHHVWIRKYRFVLREK